MEEITPDFIARLATKIYNEVPRQGSAPDEAALPAPPHAPDSLPEAMSFLASQTTATAIPGIGGLPAAPTISSFASPASGHSLSPFPSSPTAFPGFSNLPFPPLDGSIPGAPSLPTFAGAPPVPSSSPDGLKSFLAGVRHSNFSNGHLPRSPGHASPHSAASGTNFKPGFWGSNFAPSQGTGARPLDVPSIRQDFPVLHQKINGKQLVWFDNAATTQKPQSVIDAISHFYENDYSNIHRAAHSLAARATDAYEKSRQKVQSFIGASSIKEVVFVRGTTEGINLIANIYGRKFLQPGDEIVISTLEHHAQIVPWQMIAKEKGANLRVIPVNDRGEIMLEEYQKLLGPRTKVVALTQASNSLGTILPVAEMTQMAKRYGARVIIDGAQSVAHIPVNVQALGCDFFVFSGHKIFGPTGIGVAYIKEELHDILPPWQGGGNMIQNVTFEETTFSPAPAKFEAGTPNIADAVGLGAALDYLSRLGLPNVANYEHELLQYATEGLLKINGLRLIGTAREKVGVLSFVLPNYRSEEIGRLLDQEGIAVRSGHHCSQPSLRRFGVETTVRPSLAFYNTHGEIDRLVDALKRIRRIA